MKIKAFAFASALTVAMLTGCTLFSNNSAAVLWTNRPELAAYAELYNARTEGGKIEVVYKETPWLALETESSKPALVAGTRLDSAGILKDFQTLDKMIRKGLLDTSLFYTDLLNMGYMGGKCYLLPVSFSLPAVIFKADLAESIPDDYIITYEQMRGLSEGFNIVDDRPTHMGYSPRWQPEFMYNLSRLAGANFRESDSGLPVWNETKVREAIAFAADWVESANGGYDLEYDFESKYMYDPLYKLLDTGRILFNYITIDELLSIPAETRENLDFRWLSDGAKIEVAEDVLFIGVPKQSRQRRTAEAFISWLFSYDTQVALLESAQFKRMRFFGFAGGLSSLSAVNTDAIPRFFPFLLGHIPHGGYLDFPHRLPKSWERMREEVIIPWLADSVSEEGSTETLADSLARWRLRQPEAYR